MSMETLPHQIDQTALASGPPGTRNEAHGAEMPEAWLDWFHRAMSALVAVGPPPPGITPPLAGTIPHLVPKSTLPAQGEVTPDVPPYHIDASNELGDPQDRLELIRAAFNYARANLAFDEQATTCSEADRSNSLVNDRFGALANPSGINLASTTYAPGDLHVTIPHQLDQSPTPHGGGAHSPPTPSADVVLATNAIVHSAGSRIEDAVMTDRPQDDPISEGTMTALPSAMGTADHGTSWSSGDREENEDKAMVVRASSTLQQSALSSASTTQDVAAYEPRALQRQEEQRRRVWEDKKRVWSSKDATPTRGNDGNKGHSSRGPKTRRQASPAPALLKRMTDLRPNACSYSSERNESQPPLTPTHSPRDRSPTPSTPPPSECAGLPLLERLRPIPLVSRIGPYADESGSAAFSAQANKQGHSSSLTGRMGSRVGQPNSASSSGRANGETHGRRTARAPKSLEPSGTPSRDTGLLQALPTREMETAPTAATFSPIASAGLQRVASNGSRTIASADSLKAEGARNFEHRLESASPRPVTLVSSAPGSTTLKTAQEATSVGVGETFVSGNLPSDTMVVGDPVEPTTPSVASAVTTTIIAPQITTPLPPSTTPSSIDDTSISPRNSGPLSSRANSASSAPRFQASSASMSDDRNAGTMETRPHTSPRCTYRQIAEELLSSTIPLDRSHCTRAQEVAPAHAASIVLPASPAAPAASTSTLTTLSSVSEPTGKEFLPFSPLPTRALDSSPTSSSPVNGSSSPPIDPAELGEYIFGLPVDNPAPVLESDAPIEQTMVVEQDGEEDQLVETDEQSNGPLKVDEDEVDEPMKLDEHTAVPVKMEEDTDEIKEKEEPVAKTENELAPKAEDVKDEMLVPVELAPRYEPRALIPKSRQHSAVSPSIGPSHSSFGHTTNSQSFWIEMPPRTLPQESYLPMSQDGCQPSGAQDEQQPLIPPPEQALRRSTRSTSSVYRRATPAQANSVRMAASAPASSASAKSQIQPPSSDTAASQLSSASVQSSSAIVQLSPASAQSFSVPARATSTAAATGPSSAPTNAIVASLGRSYRLPPSSEDEEEDARVTPILKLRRMNDDHPLERPSKRVRWA